MKFKTIKMIADAINGNDALSIEEFTEDMNNFGDKAFEVSSVLKRAVKFGSDDLRTTVKMAVSANRIDIAERLIRNSTSAYRVDVSKEFGLEYLFIEEGIHLQVFNSWMEAAEEKSRKAIIRIQHASAKAAKKASLKAKREARNKAKVEELIQTTDLTEAEIKVCLKHARKHRISISKYMELRDIVLDGVSKTTAKVHQAWELFWLLNRLERDNTKVQERFIHDLRILYPPVKTIDKVKTGVKKVTNEFKTIYQHKNGKVIKFTYQRA